jgi:hypothetical protein
VGLNQVVKLCGFTRRSMCWRILSQEFDSAAAVANELPKPF